MTTTEGVVHLRPEAYIANDPADLEQDKFILEALTRRPNWVGCQAQILCGEDETGAPIGWQRTIGIRDSRRWVAVGVFINRKQAAPSEHRYGLPEGVLLTCADCYHWLYERFGNGAVPDDMVLVRRCEATSVVAPALRCRLPVGHEPEARHFFGLATR